MLKRASLRLRIWALRKARDILVQRFRMALQSGNSALAYKHLNAIVRYNEGISDRVRQLRRA